MTNINYLLVTTNSIDNKTGEKNIYNRKQHKELTVNNRNNKT